MKIQMAYRFRLRTSSELVAMTSHAVAGTSVRQLKRFANQCPTGVTHSLSTNLGFQVMRHAAQQLKQLQIGVANL